MWGYRGALLSKPELLESFLGHKAPLPAIYFPPVLLCLSLVWSVLRLLRGFDARGGLGSIETPSDTAPRQLSCCVYVQPSSCRGFGVEPPFTLMCLGLLLSWRSSFPFSRALGFAGNGHQIVGIVLHGICFAASFCRPE